MRLLAIDPGPTESAYIVINSDCTPIEFGKISNDNLMFWLDRPTEPIPELPTLLVRPEFDHAVIEMVASYGMAVGAEVFETCVWIGRFYESAARYVFDPDLIKRLPVKVHHCKSAKAKDANITQALVDRFAAGQPNHGKGTKTAPGFFYGFKADVWAAYALAVYAIDKINSGERP